MIAARATRKQTLFCPWQSLWSVLGRPAYGAALLLVTACTPARPPAPREPTKPPPAAPPAEPPAPVVRERDRFAVASENEPAVLAARGVLERGGSAADAAITGVLVGCAAHPASCGLGGGGAAMLFRQADQQTTYLDFREAAPAGLRRVDYLSKNPPSSRRGVLVGVPGLSSGLLALHQRAGKLPLGDLIGGAADQIEKGIPLSAYMAQALVWNGKWLREDERARTFGMVDADKRVGEVLHNAALVATMRTWAQDPAGAFVNGALADDVIKSARAHGSRIAKSDLAKYRVIPRQPLKLTWDRFEVLAAPPSSGGGVTLLSLLAMFERSDLVSLELGSAALVHALAEGFRLSYEDRVLGVGDPDFHRVDPSGLFDREKMRARRSKLRPNATSMPKVPSIGDSGTFQIVVVDAAGDVVCLTASVTGMFGAKIVTDGGYVLNDALRDFQIDDYGLRAVTRGPNFARGGARPVSNFVPTLVLESGSPRLALGGSGGLRAITGVAQVLIAALAFDRPVAEAIERPRFHVTAGGSLKLDEGLAALAPDLASRGEVVDPSSANFSSVTGISIRSPAGVRTLEPAFDPRKGGAVTVEHGELRNQAPAPAVPAP